MKTDEYGLIVQTDGDGGDTLAHTGFVALGLKMHGYNGTDCQEARAAIEKCYIGNGLWVRHPHPTMFWSDPKLTTRDQLVLTFPMLRIYGEWSKLFATSLECICTAVAQNTRSTDGKLRLPDLMIPVFSTIIRSWYPFSIPFYPLVLFFDLFLLAGIVFDIIPYRWNDEPAKFVPRSPNDVDDDNCVGQLAAAILWLPTPFSWLARRLHAKHRPWNYGCTPCETLQDARELTILKLVKLDEHPPVYGSLRWYHRASANGNPDIAELWKPTIEKYWSFN